MKYLIGVLLWLILSTLWGLFMTGIGPGIVMLFFGFGLGVCGAVFSIVEQLSQARVPILYAGIIVATIATLLASLTLEKGSFPNFAIVTYLFLTNLIPSYVILFLLKMILRKLPAN